MPDQKISDLPDGAPPQDIDEYVIARAGSNFSLSYGAMTSGGVSSLSGVGAVTVATNGSTISIGAPAQSVQTQNLVALTLDGNTAGALALASSGTVTLAGGNNITLSQAGNAITISGANAGGAQTGISGIANSEATYTSGTVELVGTGAITIASNAGQQFVFSVNPQSTQVETQTFIAGISASDTLYTSGNVRITGVGGGVTVSSNTGQRIDISVAAQSVQPETQTFIAGVSASDTLYTSGNVRFTGVGGGITVSSNTGQRVDLSVAAPVAQTNQAGSVYAISNTSGTSSGTYDARTLSIAGAGMITVAASNSGWRINATQSVQPETQTFIGGISASDTLYTSGSVRFTGSQAVTVRSGTGQLVVIDAPAQTTQTQGILSMGVSTGGNTAGNTQVSTGSRMVLVGLGEVSLSQATAAGASTISISAPAQTVQTQGGFLSVGVSTGGNTLGNTQVSTGTRLVIVGSGMITASQATAAGASTITLNATQSVQPETQTFIGGISASDTLYTSGNVRFTGVGGGVTVSSNTGQRVDISVAAPVAATNLSVGASNIGNTSGDTGVATGSRLVIAGGNNITISQGTAAGATTLTISAPNLGAGAMSAGVSTGGNTAGATGITGTQLVLVGSDNITLSQTTGANGGTVSIFGPAAGGFSMGVSTGGNTAGATGVTGTRVVLVGDSPISLSQTTGAAGATISIDAPATSSLSATGGIQISTNGSTISIGDGTLADWQNMPQGNAALETLIAAISKTPFYWHDSLPQKITANSLAFKVSFVTANTLASFSAHLGVYTFVNSTSMALLGSHSEAYVISSATSASFSGVRNLVMTGIGTHTALSALNPGVYGFGMMFSAGASQSMNASIMGASTANGPLGMIFPGTNSVSAGTSQGVQGLWGRGSTTVDAMPANVVRSELVNQGSGVSMALHPWIYIRS